ncbi:lipoprotein [Pseudomonas asuensis]|jgi:tetrahydromethanopterin S-methyltransferase subunit G|uniref:Lipoprotein n=1 Tax=Pseudomonas asuensis TaxID=1825787 RepID=A0ABQ2GLZ7_9PSED|nr:DUF6279 family lipoprotein [Pseudomonas asuensis]GGM02024.1 lipoprotein [Pseudomonas asuensis]
MRIPLSPWLVLFAIALSIGACTRVGFAYKHLNTLIPWSISDYLDMNSEQRRWFDDRLAEHLRWHCSHELPRYLDWMDGIKTMVRDQQVSPLTIKTRMDELKEAVDTLAVEITPTSTDLLRKLSDQQVAELKEELDRDIKDRRKKYLDPSRGEQIRERAARMEERVNFWTGPLNQAQKDRIMQWSVQLGDQNQAWVGNRIQWQRELLDALQHRAEPDFPQRVKQLLQDRESLWAPAYRESFSKTQDAAVSLINDLYTTTSETQRNQIISRLADIQKDLAPQRCDKAKN